MESLPKQLTEEEIRIEKILDQMDLARLEDERMIYDMDGYADVQVGRGWKQSLSKKLDPEAE